MRTIGVVTVGRSDYGIYLPLLRAIHADPDLKLYLIVSGMHLTPEFGLTVREIEKDGFEIGQRVEMLLSSDTPEGIAKSMGLGMIGFAQAYSRFQPDIIVVLGDRFEMFTAALAALPFRIPVAHIHGGEVTQGAIDDALRHSITKLSHLHFVSTQEYARRVIQLGEEPWRVVVCGALSLDNLFSTRLLSRKEIQDKFRLQLLKDFLLITYHPVALEYEQTGWQIDELLAAVKIVDLPVVFTMPNADINNHIIRQQIANFVSHHPDSQVIENLGTQGYFSLMNLARAMVGNSSSGIVEAAIFNLPVVNIGTRQLGRIRSSNIIDVGNKHSEIIDGIHLAISSKFKTGIRNMVNPYGDGKTADRIVQVLKQTTVDDRLFVKRFVDFPILYKINS